MRVLSFRNALFYVENLTLFLFMFDGYLQMLIAYVIVPSKELKKSESILHVEVERILCEAGFSLLYFIFKLRQQDNKIKK
ncbi:MAG: hypothetical protein ACI8RD_008079 [Bacillariaceae sp.]|jgi:hypothetical protein